ncbi:thiamine biosynthesis lipoprotein [Pilibacter termitis]|uniref:FAD:protein FMN transferase n=1 Tax=Pilibacter termitis TaxID=263852 RepID=A0A1T4QSU7_9ENTE|nr:FAD:protein FMN transferase [Pilibacter termitis]SKA06849.1 thiamine biosynthesis lipoprotein [Pilibacter termitis]
MKKTALGLGILSLFLLAACSSSSSKSLLDKPLSQKEFQTGTYTEIKIYDKDKKDVMKKAFEKIQELESKIEVHEEGISEIDRVNSSAGKQAEKVSPDVLKLLQQSLKGAKETDGEFNPTIGAITNAWHIGFPDAAKPTDKALAESVKKVDYNKVELDEEKSTVFLKETGMSFDLGGVGKGWIAEQVIADMKKENVTTAVLNFGGHVFTIGENPHNKTGEWTINLGDPSLVEGEQKQPLPTIAKIKTKHSTFITTSMYARYLLVGDTIYSHLMNGKTGKPYQTNLVAVTIIGDNPVEDDILSNALYGMGVEKGMEYVNNHKEIEAIFATSDKKLHISKGLEGKITLEKNSAFTIKD